MTKYIIHHENGIFCRSSISDDLFSNSSSTRRLLAERGLLSLEADETEVLDFAVRTTVPCSHPEQYDAIMARKDLSSLQKHELTSVFERVPYKIVELAPLDTVLESSFFSAVATADANGYVFHRHLVLERLRALFPDNTALKEDWMLESLRHAELYLSEAEVSGLYARLFVETE